MTTLAIIGGGIAGKSLLFALAKSKKKFAKILLFDSDSFAHTCSLRSTAVVAPRGVSTGHSELGDLLLAGYQTFSEHVGRDLPAGVFSITQYSAATTKLEQFKTRYPQGSVGQNFPAFSLIAPIYMATEAAYLIDTQMYLPWLLKEASSLPVEVINEFVSVVNDGEIKTQTGKVFKCDKVVFAGGASNRFWNEKKAGKPVQGSYFEFENTDLGAESFSLTLEGDNLIYHAHSKKLLVGSTTSDPVHELAPVNKLSEVYSRLQGQLTLKLPPQANAKVIVGMREKAAKRAPYLLLEDKTAWMGGFYKNGYSLGLHLSQVCLESQFFKN